MLYKLPKPDLGCTHIDIYVRVFPGQSGMPEEKKGNFRGDDLLMWLDKYGYSRETKTWEDPVVEPVVEQVVEAVGA